MGRRDARRQDTYRLAAAADRYYLGDAAKLPAPAVDARRAEVIGHGYCTSGGSAPAPGWPRTPSPSARVSRADPGRRPPARLPSVKAVLTRRAPAGALSRRGRVDGDGMAKDLR
jgi:hypothetical protein